MTLFAYPQKAAFGRVLPKSKIYERAGASKATRNLFVSQIEQIVWAYKLAPETINIPATKTVSEIQVFSVILREWDFNEAVLRCIDKAIPFPILFELSYEDMVKFIAAYKRPNEAKGTKWIISPYFETQWQTEDTSRALLPITLDLGTLYAELLGSLIPFPPKHGESLQEHVSRTEAIRSLQQKIIWAEMSLKCQKQFNRKVEINANIRTMRQEVADLTGRT